MENEDKFKTFDGYDRLLDRLKDACKQQQVVLIYLHRSGSFHAIMKDWLHDHNEKLKGLFGDSLRLMQISNLMKEAPKIFGVHSFPSFLLLDHNLKVLDKFCLQDYMGGDERLLSASMDVLGGHFPDPPYSKFEERLLDGINDALKKEVLANSKPDINSKAGILKRLMEVISNRNAWIKQCPEGAYDSLK